MSTASPTQQPIKAARASQWHQASLSRFAARLRILTTHIDHSYPLSTRPTHSTAPPTKMATDSPFSLTSNIFAILTFFLLLFLSCLAFQASTQDPNEEAEEVEEFATAVQRTKQQIHALRQAMLTGPQHLMARKVNATDLNRALRDMDIFISAGKTHSPALRMVRAGDPLFNLQLKSKFSSIFGRRRHLFEMRKLERLKAEVLVALNTYIMGLAIFYSLMRCGG